MKQIVTLALTLTLLFSDCASYHSGYMQSSGSLSSANFHYVKTNVQGKVTAVYFLGIGGLSKKALTNEAKQDLINQYPLKANQALVNLTVDYKLSYYVGIIHTRTCIVTGDIVEFENE